MIADGLYYTKEHEWLKVTGTVGTVGITDHAQELLGEVTFVELPPTGKTVQAGDMVSAVESSKAASDVYAPLAGTITAVNDALEGSPERINDSCYEEGWICKIELTDPAGVSTLMDAKQYETFVNEQEQ
jgi:glycine cleavage system H protein